MAQLANAIAWVLCNFPSRMRSVTEENINRCFPQLTKIEKKCLLKNTLASSSLTFLESTKAWTSSSAASRSKIYRIEGKEELDRLYAEGNGILFIIPHLGNWEYLNHYLGNIYHLTHMYLPNKSKAINHIIQYGRVRSGAVFVEASRSGIKQQLEKLKAGGAIGLMPDQEPENHTGKFSPFFGIQALSSELVLRYLEKTNATPVLAYCIRRADKTGFDVAIEILDVDLSLEKMNTAITSAVKKYPEQYLWSYKRFRTRPDGEPDFYGPQSPSYLEAAKQFVLGYLCFSSKFLSFSFINNFSKVALLSNPFIREQRKIAQANLSLCSQNSELLVPSMVELTKLALETGKIWHSEKSTFDTFYNNDQFEHQFELTGKGAIVLTPPLGNREIVMRYLGQHYETTEYYHPANKLPVDRLIREARRTMSINLVQHDKQGREKLLGILAENKVITLCPDQQPRLRGGEFIPFFSCPALTTTTLSKIIKESAANLYFGVAIRKNGKFELMFIPLEYDIEKNDKQLLTYINQALEKLIGKNPSQYRWSDKRFNIRPPSMAKVYA